MTSAGSVLICCKCQEAVEVFYIPQGPVDTEKFTCVFCLDPRQRVLAMPPPFEEDELNTQTRWQAGA